MNIIARIIPRHIYMYQDIVHQLVHSPFSTGAYIQDSATSLLSIGYQEPPSMIHVSLSEWIAIAYRSPNCKATETANDQSTNEEEACQSSRSVHIFRMTSEVRVMFDG